MPMIMKPRGYNGPNAQERSEWKSFTLRFEAEAGGAIPPSTATWVAFSLENELLFQTFLVTQVFFSLPSASNDS